MGDMLSTVCAALMVSAERVAGVGEETETASFWDGALPRRRAMSRKTTAPNRGPLMANHSEGVGSTFADE
jgi:hypothetical protein